MWKRRRCSISVPAVFLDYIKANYEGKTLLAVGHGLINRAVQARIQGVTLQHLRSVPKMDNAELRLFML